MGLAACRNEVANAEALFVAQMADTHNRMHLLIGEVRAAATPVRVGIVAMLTGTALYFVRPRLTTLLRIPLLLGAVDSVVQHFGSRVGAEPLRDADGVG